MVGLNELMCIHGVLLSTLPVVEVRGAIPYLIASNCPWYYLVLCYLISTATGIVVYLVLDELLKLVKKILSRSWRGGLKLLDNIMSRAERGAGPKVERYGTLGLALFVGVPLPGTGVWTGALAGYLLGLKKSDVILALALGNLIATVLVLIVSAGAKIMF